MAENGWNDQRRNGNGGGGNASFFGLPKLFTSFTAPKAASDNETIISPKSILDEKPFSTLRNSFWSDPNNNSPRTSDSKRAAVALGSCSLAGLGIVNVLQDEELIEASAKPDPRPALFGSKLKIQISPLTNATSENPTPRSPSDFGIKTKNSNSLSNNSAIRSPVPNGAAFDGCLSPREMELSEDYTCVISHGPNPKTTHIYCDCILENCCNSADEFSANCCSSIVIEFSASTSPETRSLHPNGHQKQNFLSLCDGCNKSLEENDIYMYRGEKAFCCCECRLQEILMEERTGETEIMKL